MPLSRGGLDTISNLLPTCLDCNSDKRDMTLHEWAAYRTSKGLSIRVTEWTEDDQRYWHLTSVNAGS